MIVAAAVVVDCAAEVVVAGCCGMSVVGIVAGMLPLFVSGVGELQGSVAASDHAGN